MSSTKRPLFSVVHPDDRFFSTRQLPPTPRPSALSVFFFPLASPPLVPRSNVLTFNCMMLGAAMYFQGKPYAVALAKKYDSERKGQGSGLNAWMVEQGREKGIERKQRERKESFYELAAWRPVNIIFGMKQSRRPLLAAYRAYVQLRLFSASAHTRPLYTPSRTSWSIVHGINYR